MKTDRPTESLQACVGRSLSENVTDRIVREFAEGHSETLLSAVHFLTHCRVCGEKLSDRAEENLAVGCKAGPLLFHLHCADVLRLTLTDSILYRSA